MLAWRLTSARHPPLTGEGARLAGGRWNSPGRPLVYASETLALCLAEALVHLPRKLPSDYVAYRLRFPDDELETLDEGGLKEAWQFDLGYSRTIGDQWLDQRRSLALAVPSIVLPESTNLLFNPLHPRAAELVVQDQRPFRFDPRLRP